MITFEQALAQIDPNTGFPDVRPGSLFDQYSKQQEASLANMRATTVLTPEQQYMQANPDVLQFAADTARSEGIAPGADFGARTSQIAQQHYLDRGQTEGRASFDMADELGRPLSSFVNGVFPGADAINTQPFPVSTVTAPMATFDQTTGQDVQTNMTGPTNFGPAPLPGQLPGYSFTGNPDFYANALGTMGGLLDDTSAFYAGQVPAAPTTAVQTGGYNFPELAMYPNANYAAGISPFIFTG
tara:strand:+ start:31 stop:756 length:726 start_codon:yes stop_codon:yes gene_type:complete